MNWINIDFKKPYDGSCIPEENKEIRSALFDQAFLVVLKVHPAKNKWGYVITTASYNPDDNLWHIFDCGYDMPDSTDNVLYWMDLPDLPREIQDDIRKNM